MPADLVRDLVIVDLASEAILLRERVHHYKAIVDVLLDQLEVASYGRQILERWLRKEYQQRRALEMRLGWIPCECLDDDEEACQDTIGSNSLV